MALCINLWKRNPGPVDSCCWALVDRSVPYVTIVPDDSVSVLCEKAVMFDDFVYTSTGKCLGVKAEVCKQ